MQIRVDPKSFAQLEQMRRTLMDIGPQVEKRILGDALLGFAREVAQDAKRLAPRRTGALRKAIRASKYRNKIGYPPAAFVTTRNKRLPDVTYGFILEHGVEGRFKGRKFLEKAFRNAENKGLRSFVTAYNKAFRRFGERELRKSYAQGYRN